MIRVRDITKRYGTKEVVKEATLTLPEKKLTAFIGSNGAGKSTLFSIISRTVAKNSGEVLVDDKQIEDWKNEELAKKIAVLKQSNHMNIRLTVRELVNFGRFPHSKGKLTKEDIRKVEDALEYLGIAELADSYLDELSGGQRQLAYIAMVVAQDTEYIFLDEPLNNLDMKHSVQIMKVLRRLVEELGKTVIVVIHDINFVSCYADYVVAMKHGRIVKCDETKEVMKEEVLEEIYGLSFDIQVIGGKNICLYYE